MNQTDLGYVLLTKDFQMSVVYDTKIFVFCSHYMSVGQWGLCIMESLTDPV